MLYLSMFLTPHAFLSVQRLKPQGNENGEEERKSKHITMTKTKSQVGIRGIARQGISSQFTFTMTIGNRKNFAFKNAVGQ